MLRRVAAGALLRLSLPTLDQLPRQFVLRRDGCLTVASLVRAALEPDPLTCLLTVDLRNAFNCVSRTAVIEASDKSPLARYSRWCYSTSSRLRYGSYIIDSKSGVQQGDPAGPALFAMALSFALQRARTSFAPDLLDLWYADDGVLVGSATEVTQGFTHLIEPLTSIGLEINKDKIFFVGFKYRNRHRMRAPVRERNNYNHPIIVLGYPAEGAPTAVSSFISNAVDRSSTSVEAISRLCHAQGEACILRACGPTSKLRHLLRFCDVRDLKDWIPLSDKITLDCVERIIARPCPPGWQRVAAAPANMGGLEFMLLHDLDCRTL